MDPITTNLTIHEKYGKQLVPNITLEEAKFWGRPNFSGEEDRFKDSRRKFNVLVTNEQAELLREIGYPAKTLLPTPERLAENPDEEPLSFIKVMIDNVVLSEPNADGLRELVSGPNIKVLRAAEHERLDNATMGILDRARINRLDLELRAWNYNDDEVKQGIEEPKFSARLVTCIAVLQVSPLADRYGNIL